MVVSPASPCYHHTMSGQICQQFVAPEVSEIPVAGEYLRSLRRPMRVSLRQMAKELEKDGYPIDFSLLARIESGDRPMPDGLLVQYLKTLNRIWEEDGKRLGRLRRADEA